MFPINCPLSRQTQYKPPYVLHIRVLSNAVLLLYIFVKEECDELLVTSWHFIALHMNDYTVKRLSKKIVIYSASDVMVGG